MAAVSIETIMRFGPRPVNPEPIVLVLFVLFLFLLFFSTAQELVGQNAQAINRRRLHPQDDGTKRERLATMRARERDFRRREIPLWSDDHQHARRPRALRVLVLGQDLFQMQGTRLK